MAYRLLILLLLAATVGYLVLARQIPLDPWSARELVNSRTLPTVYGLLLALVLVALLFQPAPPAQFPRQVARAGGLMAVALVCAGLVPRIGIWFALGLMLLVSLLLMGERRPTPVLAIAVGIPVLGWWLVERLLGIYVPGGDL